MVELTYFHHYLERSRRVIANINFDRDHCRKIINERCFQKIHTGSLRRIVGPEMRVNNSNVKKNLSFSEWGVWAGRGLKIEIHVRKTEYLTKERPIQYEPNTSMVYYKSNDQR